MGIYIVALSLSPPKITFGGVGPMYRGQHKRAWLRASDSFYFLISSDVRSIRFFIILSSIIKTLFVNLIFDLIYIYRYIPNSGRE